LSQFGGKLKARPEVQFDLHADPTTGIISGFIYGQDQIFCGNVNSTEWLVTQFKASNQAGSIPQYYCLLAQYESSALAT
jgi:hypothetical protein